MAWWNGPDPYTYERIGIHWSGRPVYVVSLDGKELGVIEPYRASTDRPTHRGSRIRRPGRGRDEFRRSDYQGGGGSKLTRRDVAHDLEEKPMTKKAIADYRRLLAVQEKRRSS